MAKRKYNKKQKSELERLLEAAEKRLAHYENQKAGFGELYVPAHIQLEIDKTKEKVALLRRQITQINKKKPFYALRERVKLFSRTMGDLIAPYDSASRRRKTLLLKRMRSSVIIWLLFLISFAFIIVVLMWQNVLSLDRFASFNILQNGPLTEVQASRPISLPTIEQAQGETLDSVQQDSTVLAVAEIANTGGAGVRFRTEPRQDAPSNGKGLNENTTVYLLDSLTNEVGEIWWKVRLDDGRVGYVWEVYILLK